MQHGHSMHITVCISCFCSCTAEIQNYSAFGRNRTSLLALWQVWQHTNSGLECTKYSAVLLVMTSNAVKKRNIQYRQQFQALLEQ